MKGFVNGYYTFAVWITRLAYVNLLWVLFTIVGLLFLGFFPATAAMFSVTRKWVLGEKDIPIFRVFWNAYKKEFIRVNVIGIILFISIYVLSVQFQILRAADGIGYFITSYVILVFFMVLFIIILYIFPIFAHFELKIWDYFKWSLVISFIHPVLTFFLLIVVGTLNYLTFLLVPGLLFFLNGSVTAYILIWGVSQTFEAYEETSSHQPVQG